MTGMSNELVGLLAGAAAMVLFLLLTRGGGR